MTLTAFEASPRLAFVGSPMLARNNPALSVDTIGRLYGWLDGVNTSTLISAFQSFVFPTNPILIGARSNSQTDASLGDRVQTQLFQQGWSRTRWIVWGICNTSNPWVAPGSSYTIPTAVPGYAWDDNPEIYLVGDPVYADFSEDIEANRTDIIGAPGPPPNRIPLNCVHPDNAEGYAPAKTVVRIERTIEASMFAPSPGPLPIQWSWWRGEGMHRMFNHVARVGSTLPPGYRFEGATLLPTNNSRINPSAPVLLKGQSITYFQSLPIFPNTGGWILCFALLSVSPDTQKRPLIYTDSIFEPLT